MTHLDLFSGIGGFALAAQRAGDIRTIGFCELDPFCRRVLKRHWPDVPIYEDIRAIDPAGLGAVDLLTGGWPCQGNSVAGQRRGHADERSGLFAEILRLLDGLAPRPRWVVLENVPGLASVSEGRDFPACVHELRRRGYVGCVRTLDAQHFGLAQRRKRLFFVCGVGAAGLRAVQLVLEGGRRYPAPRRETGQGPAASLTHGSNGPGVSYPGRRREDDVNLAVAGPLGGGAAGQGWRGDLDTQGAFVAQPLLGKSNSSHDDSKETYIPVAGSLTARYGDSFSVFDAEEGNFIPLPPAIALCQNGSDVQAVEDRSSALRDGHGVGVPAVCIQSVNRGEKEQNGAGLAEDVAYTVTDRDQHAVCIPLDLRNAKRTTDPDELNRQGLGVGEDGEPAPTLSGSFVPGVAHSLRSEGFDASEDGTGRGTPLMAFPGEPEIIQEAQTGVRLYPSVGAIRADAPGSQPTGSLLKNGASVRRLTPTECERLQGFSRPEDGSWRDGWTCLCGKNAGRSHPAEDACSCPDGPRYRALGNAVAIPPVEWLLRRVLHAESQEVTP